MRPRIMASKVKVTQVEDKVNRARQEGDVSTFRRGQAILAVLAGETYDVIAMILGVTPEIIRQWVQKFLAEGPRFLKIKYGRGRPPLLSKAHKKELYTVIKGGPEVAGYEGGCWRSPMVQHLIHQRFGVFYSTAYIAQLLKSIGLSFQKACFESSHNGARYHTSEEMQAFFYEHKERITPFQMPAYSPDYNPIEALWKKIKVKGVHLKFFPTFESLVSKVDELLAEFANLPKEVLKVFGFYTKTRKP